MTFIVTFWGSMVLLASLMTGQNIPSRTPLQTKIREMQMISIYLPDYCPTMQSCKKGVHIVCVYDPYFTDRLGPRCDSSKNLTLTNINKNRILALINYIRGRVAMGIETGKDNLPLYRAYNMPQLDWDNHLAAFAQILANQCNFKHDLCRATLKFPDPGQSIGLMRFTYPDWQTIRPTKSSEQFDDFDDRVEYAIQHIIRRWYQQKINVTNQMITKTTIQSRRNYLRDITGCSIYLQLISGKSTHIGCGVSAYSDYVHTAEHPYSNMIHLVCNFSHKQKINDPVYEVRKVNKDECGCENDIGHSKDCLCHSYYPPCGKETATEAQIEIEKPFPEFDEIAVSEAPVRESEEIFDSSTIAPDLYDEENTQLMPFLITEEPFFPEEYVVITTEQYKELQPIVWKQEDFNAIHILPIIVTGND